MINEITDEIGDQANICKLNVDDHKKEAIRMKSKNIPNIMILKNGERRVWCKVELDDCELYNRPESQGGSWVLAQRMKLIGVDYDLFELPYVFDLFFDVKTMAQLIAYVALNQHELEEVLELLADHKIPPPKALGGNY